VLVLAVLAGALLLAALVVALAAARLGRRGGGRGRAQEDRGESAARAAASEARKEAAAVIALAREEAVASRVDALDELGARRTALEVAEQRLAERARALDERRRVADERRRALDERRTALETDRAELAAAAEAVARRREEIAGLDRDAAAATVLVRIEGELAAEHPGRVQRATNGRVGDLVPTALMHIGDAIQRQDASHIDSAPRAVPIPLDGLGDEARTRLLDALTAISEETTTDLGIDAERNQATLRGLDPVGREVARQASLEVLERRLRSDEVSPLLLRTRRGLAREVTALGERALWEMGIDARPELAELLGTLHYRFSYGQNALLHCRETGYLCAMLAAELRMDPEPARAAGLLHDIGKAVDHDVEGSHAIIGGELLTVLGTDGSIVHAVKAHHFDEEPATDLAMLTICADAVSASRPGARRDTLTTYLQRLEQLQQIATRHTGVERAFPMQAGREVRVAVRPDQVPDEGVAELCTEIAREIEAEMTYPGMIKVTVIRETSASATAS
jgi:ribonuclease Y